MFKSVALMKYILISLILFTNSSLLFADVERPAPPWFPPSETDSTTLVSDSFTTEMVKIEGGTFEMGGCDNRYKCDKDRKPKHKVEIKTFWLGKYEVTNQEYVRFLNAVRPPNIEGTPWYTDSSEYPTSHIRIQNGQYYIENGYEQYPVSFVNWLNAQAYIHWINKITRKNYRLPSEAEWEYAALSGSKKKYPWGNKINHNKANYGTDECCRTFREGKDKWKKTAPKGKFYQVKPGLFDLHGNVLEWVADCWHRNYKGAPDDGSVWEKENRGQCYKKVVRGGSFLSPPENLRSKYRTKVMRKANHEDIGFRLARSD